MNRIVLKALALGALVAMPFGSASASLFLEASGDFGGSHYEYYSDTGNHQLALDMANFLGGHLVTITSQAENDFVNSLTGGAIIWLGGSDTDAEGTWAWQVGPEAGTEFWIGGSSPTYANWHGGEPNNYGSGEDYLAMNHPSWSDGTWNDVDPAQQYRVVIEYSREAVPEPSVIGLLGLGLAGIGAATRRRRRS